jgi:hypothetical protein
MKNYNLLSVVKLVSPSNVNFSVLTGHCLLRHGKQLERVSITNLSCLQTKGKDKREKLERERERAERGRPLIETTSCSRSHRAAAQGDLLPGSRHCHCRCPLPTAPAPTPLVLQEFWIALLRGFPVCVWDSVSTPCLMIRFCDCVSRATAFVSSSGVD